MRISYAAALCFLTAIPTSYAFIPPRHHTTINSPCRHQSQQLQSTLSDQLASLSYRSYQDVAGSAAAKVASSTPIIEKVNDAAAATSSATDGLSFPNLSGIIDSLSSALPNLPAATSLAMPELSVPITTISSLAELSNAVVTIVQTYETLADDKLRNSIIGNLWTSTKEHIGPVLDTLIHPDLPPSVTLLIASYVTYSVVNTLLSFGQEPPPNSPYPLNKYDPVAARKYFDDKWGLVVKRAIEVSFLSGTFLSSLALDYVTGKLDANAELRAQELSVLLTKLGPSFIKIGQSLSIRTDLLSPAYVKGLKTLQDQVPPFSTSEARSIIENELGSSIDDIFVDFPNEPIAAASLGQVYQVKVKRGRNGEEEGEEEKEVAVKVQRPNIMDQIALDMHLIREVSGPIKRIFNLNTDFVGVVDTWGYGFVDELDYIEEAVNAKSFTEGIEQTPLSGVVFAPPIVDELTTRKVLTTEWVVGERLDKSGKEDVSILCSIAMNSYLTMMLETGLLHCDPHVSCIPCLCICEQKMLLGVYYAIPISSLTSFYSI